MAEFYTIAKPGKSFLKDRGSKFYGFAVHVESVEEVEKHLEEKWAEHHKARHICYAYHINQQPPAIRANDDGEPSNTGGMPILNHIEGKGLSDTLVMVVRYFGGTLLGKGGLIQAYGNAAMEAIEDAKVIKDFDKKEVKARVEFPDMDLLIRIARQNNWDIIEQEFSEFCIFTLNIPVEEYGIFESLGKKIPSFSSVRD